MRRLLLLISLTALPSLALAQAIDLAVKFNVSVVKTNLKVACVESVNSEGESSGVYYFVEHSDFPEYNSIRQTGLTSLYVAKLNCGAGLTQVSVGEYTKAKDIEDAIVKAGGFVKAGVVFYNEDLAKAQSQLALTQGFDAL